MRTDLFTPASRYYTITTTELKRPARSPVPYLQRRFLPEATTFQTIRLHVVSEGDRPDSIAAQYLSDSEQFWRLCDGNNVMHPLELVATPGQALRITLPEGINTIPYA